MRMIDGKPEYKNGLVRRQGGGAGSKCIGCPGRDVKGAGYTEQSA